MKRGIFYGKKGVIITEVPLKNNRKLGLLNKKKTLEKYNAL